MRRLVAFAAVLSLAATLASCGGGGNAKLLPGTTAAEITENLDRVKQYAEEGECVGANDAAAEVGAQVEALQDVDAKLKEALRRGVERLAEVVAGCEESPAEATTTVESTKPRRTRQQGQEKKAEREREEREAREEEGEAPSEGQEEGSEAEEQTTPAPSEGGGTGAPGGLSPSAPVGPAGGE